MSLPLMINKLYGFIVFHLNIDNTGLSLFDARLSDPVLPTGAQSQKLSLNFVLQGTMDYCIPMFSKLCYFRPSAKAMSNSNVVAASEGICQDSLSLISQLDKKLCVDVCFD
jgi:hypothetical protein